MSLWHTTADENAPYPPTLGGATHPQNWGAGGYFQGSYHEPMAHHSE